MIKLEPGTCRVPSLQHYLLSYQSYTCTLSIAMQGIIIEIKIDLQGKDFSIGVSNLTDISAGLILLMRAIAKGVKNFLF